MANVKEITRSTLMPMSRAVGLSNEVARMAIPIFVRRTRNCRNSCTRTEATMMIRNMLEKEIVLSGDACPLTMGWTPFCMYHAVMSKGLL